MAPVRVLIVDDSRVMRRLIRQAISGDRRLAVVGEAADPYEAREAIKATDPDVLTLDIEMPRMNGLDFLGKVMRLRPMPVVMFSSLTAEGSDAAIRALSMGAVDCVQKPGPDSPEVFATLPRRLYEAAQVDMSLLARATRPAPPHPAAMRWNGRVVLIGASTGGVDALRKVLARFPPDGPPTAITQHMPARFLESFADALDREVAPRVRLANDGSEIGRGEVVFCPGGSHHMELSMEGGLRSRLRRCGARDRHCPSVDVMFASAVRFASDCVCVVLTGMGRDGAQGALALRESGAMTIGQDAASSVVYGMPRAARELGAISAELPLGAIGDGIVAACGREGDDGRR